MQTIQAAVVPFLLAFTAMYAVYRGTAVFPVFIEGAKKGMQTAVGILPTMIGMLTAVYMLRASGAIDLASAWLAPLFHLLGIPQECVPLALLKPISGGGGLALGSELIRTAGPDSYVGRVAAVMLGSSETSIYHRPICRTSRAQEDSLRNSGSIMRRFGSFYDVRSAC